MHFETALPDRLDLFLIAIDPCAINIATGKNGVDPSKMIIGDLIWVYSLRETVKFSTTKLRAPRNYQEAC